MNMKLMTLRKLDVYVKTQKSYILCKMNFLMD